MTDYSAAGAGARPARSLAARLRRRQQQIGDRVHATGDADAISRGWTVTATASRLGMGSRTYRDPRFDARKSAPSGSPGTHTLAQAIDRAIRQPVRLASAIDEWVRAQNPPPPAGWTARPDTAPAVRANPEAGAR